MWAVTWFVMLLYLFDNETIIACCVSLGDDQRLNTVNVMLCNARYASAR